MPADRVTKLPYMTVNNRNGMVFIRIVYMSRLGRESKMVRVTPKWAAEFAESIAKCAVSAAKHTKPLKLIGGPPCQS